MDSVEHQGAVDSMKGKSMRVRIEQSSACRDCCAQKLCSSADKQDKLIDIPSFFGSFHVRQSVVVIGKLYLNLLFSLFQLLLVSDWPWSCLQGNVNN